MPMTNDQRAIVASKMFRQLRRVIARYLFVAIALAVCVTIPPAYYFGAVECQRELRHQVRELSRENLRLKQATGRKLPDANDQ